MCFNTALYKEKNEIEEYFQAEFINPDLFFKFYHAAAFSRPGYPLITNTNSAKIVFYNWGLIPFWVKDYATAQKISSGTYNARCETLFSKPSFRGSIQSKRCIVPVNGFFEWHDHQGVKIPFFIHFKDQRLFGLAGIWDSWQNPQNASLINTFSIITTEANAFMQKVHNQKQRMPVILPFREEKSWLDNSLNKPQIEAFFVPNNDLKLIAYPVSKNILDKEKSNQPDILNPVAYPGIKDFM